MEQKNNELIDQISAKVDILKKGASGLGDIIREDERQLNDIQNSMGSASGLLGQAMGNFDNMMQTGGTKVTCYLACFIFFVFILFYWILSSKWS